MHKVPDALVAVLLTLLGWQLGRASSDRDYYPLARGSYWKYEVTKANHAKKSFVTWRVTKVTKAKGGFIYQVWPTPMIVDDEAMELLVVAEGVQEKSDGSWILKFPLEKGSEWSTNGQKLRVVGYSEPCRGPHFESGACVTVETIDQGIKLRVLTTYARGIGPVAYEYCRLGGPKCVIVQKLSLIEYGVAGK